MLVAATVLRTVVKSFLPRSLSFPKVIFDNPNSCRLLVNHCGKKMATADTTYPNNQPVISLDCSKAFNALTEKEKMYAHHLSRASWYGGLIVLVQKSPESPLIFVLLRKLFRCQSIPDLKDVALSQCGFDEEEFQAFLVYTCGILTNMGNYKSFGDSKFIPNLPKDKFQKLVLKSKAFEQQPDSIKSLLDRCLEKIYSLEKTETHLGFPDKGTTTYISKNFTREDSERVKEVMRKEGIEGYNTRAFKSVDKSLNCHYDIRFASVKEKDGVEKKPVPGVTGCDFSLSYGDYKDLLKRVNECLSKAKEYVANKNQHEMLENYIQSFDSGLLDRHKDGSRFWIKDVGPIVETYIGFIEVYSDPDGIRGEFESFVAVVNKEMSKKFLELVKNAEKFLPLLPWPKTYEKDHFLRPDFTSLDILTFAGSGIPAGINIPNYEEIKQAEGFKNVSLGNVIYSSLLGTKPNYVTEDDHQLLSKYRIGSFEVAVGLHELLGHGSGKLFKKRKDGTFNFDKDAVLHLETNEKLKSWYEDGEKYDTVFGALGSPYEECRAECVALHLSIVPEVLEIFGYKDKTDADNIIYVSWFDMCLKGIEGLQMYDTASERWNQAHCQARYVILQVILEAGEDFLNLEETVGSDGKPDLLMTMDREKIMTVGVPAIETFLRKMQLYKSTADIKSATKMFEGYSKVGDISYSDGRVYPFKKYKNIVRERKKPRKMFIQANTLIEGGSVVLRNYNSTFEGLIQSWLDRFNGEDELEDILEELWKKDASYFQ